jgi:hypothetical protein
VTSGPTPGNPTTPPPPSPSPGSGGSRGGGGGGSIEFIMLTLLGVLVFRRRGPRKNAGIGRCN